MSITVRTSSLRGYLSLMEKLGADSQKMLRRYRIDPKLLDDEDALLPLRAVANLLEASAKEANCPDFGLQLSQGQDISVLGPIAIAMQNARTVAEALSYASRYLFVQSAGLVLSVADQSAIIRNGAELRVDVCLSHPWSHRQVTDLSLADLHHMLTMLAGKAYDLKAVSLPYPTLAPARTYRSFFDAPIRAEQAHAGLHVSAATLNAPLTGGNFALRKIAIEYLSLYFDKPDQALSTRVRHAIRRTLGTDMNNKTEIADFFGIHPRTLQRRLLSEGTSFDQIRDEIRKETAIRYLRETRMPLAQLASLVGLSEQSALARSCRRWFALTPSQVRAGAICANEE